MNHEYDQHRKGSPAAATTQDDTAEPGQSSRSALLRRPEHPIASGLVQRKASDAGKLTSLELAVQPDVHASARAAVSGGASPLPFRDHIQALFGRHDISGVQAHTDGTAAAATRAMGAEAFAMGEHVGFAGTPTLHTAAHEAAHVIQQRGGVQLKGDVGQAGDVYERHADEVADAVVAGRSAEALLTPFAGNGGGAPAPGERVSGGGPAGEERQPALQPASQPRAAPETAPVQRKLGIEIEVSGSAFELQRGKQPQDLSQSQTVATRAAGGKNASLKAEGPKDRRALAEFVTDAYSYHERAGLLATVELLANQATSIAAGALGGWTVQGGDAVNILNWPEAPMGGFQVTISPVDNTVANLYRAFPAHKTTTYSREAGVRQKPVKDEEDAQLEKTAGAIQQLRLLTAHNADFAFWKWFSMSGLATVELYNKSPSDLFNVFVSLSEAMSWRFGLLLKNWGSTFKNTLDVMPKFDFVALIDKQLKPFLGEVDFERKALVVKQEIIAAFKEALEGQEGATMSVVAPSIETALGFSEQELEFYQGQLQSILEEEHSKEQSLAFGFLDKATVEQNIACKQREIAVLSDLRSGGLKSTLADIAAVVSGKTPFLGDIHNDDPESVMQDEGSLIAPDDNAPQGAFEHRNPFDSKVAAADWVDATAKFLALLKQKGVRY